MLSFARMFTIRPILLEDLPALSSLWLEQTSLLSQVDPRHTPLPNGLEQWRVGMRKLLDDEQSIALLAQDENGDFAGYSTAWEPPVGLVSGVDARIGLIGDVVIDMHHYRGGAARQIVSAVRAEFSERGVKRVVVISPRHHVVGQAFWRSMGAVEWMDLFWLR